MSFYVLQVSFQRFYYAFAKKLDKLFSARLKEKTFAFVGKRLEDLESRKIVCVHRPKFLTVSAGPVNENLSEWMQSLYKNVINRLCMATSQ